MADSPKGPASYFPSIERTYGRPIAVWKALMRGSGLASHKELVEWLKSAHGFGHGHANAITAHLLSEGTKRGTADELVDSLFGAKKAHWRAVYDRLLGEARKLGDVTVVPKKTVVGLATRAQFALLQPSTPERFDVGLKLPGVAATGRLEEAGSWNTMMTHRVRIAGESDINAELLGWIKQAYERSL